MRTLVSVPQPAMPNLCLRVSAKRRNAVMAGVERPACGYRLEAPIKGGS